MDEPIYRGLLAEQERPLPRPRHLARPHEDDGTSWKTHAAAVALMVIILAASVGLVWLAGGAA